MATRYVNTVSGLGYNDGSQNNPLKTLGHAYALSAAGDTIVLSAPVNAFLRESYADTKGITLRSAVSGQYAYISGGTNVSEGSPVQLGILNQDLSEWIDVATENAHTTYFWTMSGTRNRSTETESGLGYSALFGGSAYAQIAIRLPYNIPINISVRHKRQAPNGRPNVTIRASKSGASPTSRYWNNTTNAWQDADPGSANQPSDGSNTWATYSMAFTTNPGMSTGDSGVTYYLTVRNASSGGLYVDNIAVSTTAVNSWEQHSGSCYKKGGFVRTNFAWFVHCGLPSVSQTEFDTIYLAAVNSVESCVSTALSTYSEAGTNDDTLYVNFGSQTPSQLAIEVSEGISYGSSKTGHVTAGHADSVLTGICGFNGATGLHATANAEMNGCCGKSSYQGCLTTSNATPVWNNCVAENNNENGFSADGSNSKTSTKPVFNFCVARDNGDDGFQAIFAASFVANHCISKNSGPGNKNSNLGFSNEGSGTGMELYNCLAVRNYNVGISVDFTTGGVVKIKNCISFGNVTSEAAGEKDITIVGTPSNFTNNVVGTANEGSNADLFPSGTDGNVVANPKLADIANGLYTLLPTSPCIGAGIDVGLTTDAEGNVVPGAVGFDIGPHSYMPGWSLFNGIVPPLTLSNTSPANLLEIKVETTA